MNLTSFPGAWLGWLHLLKAANKWPVLEKSVQCTIIFLDCKTSGLSTFFMQKNPQFLQAIEDSPTSRYHLINKRGYEKLGELVYGEIAILGEVTLMEMAAT